MASGQPRLIIPALGGVYKSFDELAVAALRLACGALLVPHGMQKLFGMLDGPGLTGMAGFLDKIGYSPDMFWAVALGSLEFFGGILLALGLFTRPIAAAVVVFMVAAFFYHYPNGFLWTAKGFEVPVLWGAVALYFAIRGAGKLSLDHKLGKEF